MITGYLVLLTYTKRYSDRCVVTSVETFCTDYPQKSMKFSTLSDKVQITCTARMTEKLPWQQGAHGSLKLQLTKKTYISR